MPDPVFLAEPAPDGPYAIPEVTRALRAFARAGGAPGSDHDRYFGPLLEALRGAREALAGGSEQGWRVAIARVDATAISDAMRGVCAALADERAAGSTAARRALDAELVELAEPLLVALDHVGVRGRAVLLADAAARPAAWSAWTAALLGAFVAADACWEASLPALADPRGGMGRLWRTVLRRQR